MSGLRLVLRDEADAEQIRAFADAWGWRPVTAGTAVRHDSETDNTRAQVTCWESSREQAVICYCDDPALGLRYLEITGSGVGDAAAWIPILLPVRPADDLQALIAQLDRSPSWIDLLHLAAVLGAMDFDPERFLIIGNGFVHADPAVRRAAITATGYLSWSQFEALLSRLADADPDVAVRKYAKEMLSRTQAQG